jgi:hypothetical protein
LVNLKTVLDKYYDFLEFWISKDRGVFFPMEELDLIVDRAQKSLFSTLLPQDGKNSDVNTSLSVFKMVYNFTPGNSPAGLITIPDAPTPFSKLLLVEPTYMDEDNRVQRVECPIVNEDEIPALYNSQLFPLSDNKHAYGERAGANKIQLYSGTPLAGKVIYLREPVPPVYAYTIVGRTVIYNAGASTQLEWSDTDVNGILVSALASIGISVPEGFINQWAEAKYQQLVTTPIKI